MPHSFRFLLSFFAAGLLLSARAGEVAWDGGWLFQLGDVPGAERDDWPDQEWRPVTLPHDWSIEGATSPTAAAAGGGGFFPTGIGWYRRRFATEASWRGQHVWFESDGAYRRTDVWLNGVHLGQCPGGFYPFRYELTPHLRTGGDNVLVVRVDNSAQPSSRYYTGSGLNRHVRLRVLDSIHVEPDSLGLVTEQLSAVSARVMVRATVRNDSPSPATVTFAATLNGDDVASHVSGSASQTVEAGGAWQVALPLDLPRPQPWSPTSPALYRAAFVLRDGVRTTDRGEVKVGLRTLRVSTGRGFELNGVPLKLAGGNVHSDNGPLGTAAFDRAEERRVELLQAAGFNAVRTAHNPPSPAFLAACDRRGLLVIEEIFDGWKKKKVAHDYGADFDACWQRDLDATIARDRNHPAVVMWDIGNEPYERGNASGAAIAHLLADRVRHLDPSRPVTAGINGLGSTGAWSGVDAVLAALDVAGYNYELAHRAEDHARLPGRVILVTESYQTETYANWAAVHDHTEVIGDFVWSALDYLGEAGIGRVFPADEPVRAHWEGSHFPWHGGACGDLDLTGERKPLSHYRNIVWDRGERLYAAVRVPTADGRPWNLSRWAPPPLLASWTWPGQEGRELTVEVYSRHAAVRLFCNDRLVGERPTSVAQEFRAVFTLPYAAGVLRAVGVDSGRETEVFALVTAGPAAQLRLSVDRAVLRADGQDLAFVTVEVADAAGHVVPQAADRVTYRLNGPGSIAGLGSADLATTESYRANPRRVFQGRALVVLRAATDPGQLTLSAAAPGLTPAALTIRLERP